MGRRHFKPERIIPMLREAEIKLAGGKTTGEACRVLGQPRSTQRRKRVERDELTQKSSKVFLHHAFRYGVRLSNGQCNNRQSRVFGGASRELTTIGYEKIVDFMCLPELIADTVVRPFALTGARCA